MTITITITLIRSGATQTGLQDRFLGLVDEPLSDQGRDSLIRQAANGMYPDAELVFTSGRSRSLATAHIIYPRTPAIVLRELEPYDYGAFAGKSYRELEEDEAFRRWLASPCLVSPPVKGAPRFCRPLQNCHSADCQRDPAQGRRKLPLLLTCR